MIDEAWLASHPLTRPDPSSDKNGRGHALIVGGSSHVPGGIQLPALAALRAGAGKVQVLTIESIALQTGICLPEIAVFPLPELEGEIGPSWALFDKHLERCDSVLVGPAMTDGKSAARLIDCFLSSEADASLVIDAAGLIDLKPFTTRLRTLLKPALLTPNSGEMAALLDWDIDEVVNDPETAALAAAETFGAIVLMKGPTSFIATREGHLFGCRGGGVGMATGGSGDVLAGILAGLAARGIEAVRAAIWAIWMHAEAGRKCAGTIGPVGFLARELLDYIPSVMVAKTRA